MSGMNRLNGKRLEGIDHITQSIRDILTTPIGARVCRRDYGSRLFELLDAPLNAATNALICAATAGAISRWEPRVKLEKVTVTPTAVAGGLTLNLDLKRVDQPSPSPLTLQIPL